MYLTRRTRCLGSCSPLFGRQKSSFQCQSCHACEPCLQGFSGHIFSGTRNFVLCFCPNLHRYFLKGSIWPLFEGSGCSQLPSFVSIIETRKCCRRLHVMILAISLAAGPQLETNITCLRAGLLDEVPNSEIGMKKFQSMKPYLSVSYPF